MRKKIISRKLMTLILSTLLVLSMGLTVGLSGVFSAKAATANAPTEAQFSMLDGAEVDMSGYAIRFTTQITEDYYNAVINTYNDVRFCTEIAPQGQEVVVDTYGESLAFTNGVAEFYGVLDYADLSGVSAKEMAAMEMTAKAYVLADGNKIYAHRNDTTRSMRALANLALINGDYENNAVAEAQLKSYLGSITRQSAVQEVNSGDTYITFDSPATGYLYVNAKRCKFVVNATRVDIGEYLSEFVNGGEFTVSVFGGEQYDVVSTQAIYGGGLELIYKNSQGVMTSDYKIVQEGSGQYMSTMVPIMQSAIANMTGVSIGTASGSAYNENSKFISIGYTNALAQSGIEYNYDEFKDSYAFRIVVKDNSIFLFGGSKIADAVSTSYSAQCYRYAMDDFLQLFFGFEVYGILPQSIAKKRDITFAGFNGSYDAFVWDCTYQKGNEVIIPRNFDYYSEVDIEARQIQYDSISGSNAAYGIFRINQPNDKSYSVYAVSYEDYLERIVNEANGYKHYKCNTCGTGQGNNGAPTACANDKCASTSFREIITNSVEGYKSHTCYTCNECYGTTVGFALPSACRHCGKSVYKCNSCGTKQNTVSVPTSCTGKNCNSTSFTNNGMSIIGNTTGGNWHTNFFYLPIGENFNSHPDWYGEDSTGVQREANGRMARQLCFNAHGNALERNAMLEACLDKLVNTLTVIETDFDPEATYFFTLSDHDGVRHCECSYCKASFNKYGSMSGVVVEFINDLSKKLQLWMNDNPQHARNIAIMPFAYHAETGTGSNNGDQLAPVEWDSATNKWVGIDGLKAYDGDADSTCGKTVSTSVFLVTSWEKVSEEAYIELGRLTYIEKNGSETGWSALTTQQKINYTANNYLFDGVDLLYTAIKNVSEDGAYEYNEQRRLIQQWKDFIGDDQIYLWYNAQEFNYSTLPHYSEELFSDDFYSFLTGEDGKDIQWIFNYATLGKNAGTAYHNLRLYMTTKLNWNSTLKASELRNAWFNGVFKDPVVIEKMKEAFNYEMSMSIYAKYMATTADDNPEYQQAIANGANSQPFATYAGPWGNHWPMDKLRTLYFMYKDAFEASEGILDSNTKENVQAFIYNEWLFPTLMLLRYHMNDAYIADIQEELIANLKTMIDITGIDWDGQAGLGGLTEFYYNTQVEVVVAKVSYSTTSAADEDYKPLKEVFGANYDETTRTLTLNSSDNNYTYLVDLRVKEGASFTHNGKTYKGGDKLGKCSLDVKYQNESNEYANSGLYINWNRLRWRDSDAGTYNVKFTYELTNTNWLFASSNFNFNVKIVK